MTCTCHADACAQRAHTQTHTRSVCPVLWDLGDVSLSSKKTDLFQKRGFTRHCRCRLVVCACAALRVRVCRTRWYDILNIGLAAASVAQPSPPPPSPSPPSPSPPPPSPSPPSPSPPPPSQAHFTSTGPTISSGCSGATYAAHLARQHQKAAPVPPDSTCAYGTDCTDCGCVPSPTV